MHIEKILQLHIKSSKIFLWHKYKKQDQISEFSWCKYYTNNAFQGIGFIKCLRKR